MSSEPAKIEPVEGDELLFEGEWREELDRRRETPDSEWIDGSIGENVLADYLAKRRK